MRFLPMHFLLRALFAVLLVVAFHAHAALISVAPVSDDIDVGETSVFSVNIADVVSGAAPSVGAFDLDVSYDANVLSLIASSFGSGLDVLGLGSLRASNLSVPGLANFFEVSFDSVAQLNALQPGAFTLLTLTFGAVGSGSSTIGLLLNSLADTTGAALPATVTGAAVNVNVNGIPLPSTLFLLLAAIAGLAFTRRSRVV